MKFRIQALKSHLPSLATSIVLVAVFALGGYLAIRGSDAASYATSAQAESGTLSGNASSISDSNASGGSAVKFGTASTGGGGGTVPAVGSYVHPGEVGFKGNLSDLTVVDATHLPGDIGNKCHWDANEGITCNGSVTFDHMYIKSGIYWDSDGTLTMTNCVLEGGTPNGVGQWTIRSFGHPNNVMNISDSTLRWSINPRSNTPAASILTDGAQKMYRNDVSQGDSGFLPVHDNDEFVQNYIHDVRRVIGKSHNDGIFPSSGSNILIQQNYIDEGYDGSSQTAVLFWQGSGMSGHKVWANYLSGGGYTFYNQSATNMDVQNNTFDDTSYDGSSVNRKPLYGLTAQEGGSIAVWSGNVKTSGGTVPKP